MKRRNFIKSLSTLGLASVAMTPTLASIPGGNNKDSIRARIPISTDWDVIVVGGGPSGCAAAAAAARDGARTLLIEGTGALGGMGTSGLLNAWCPFTDGNRIIYKGIAEKVFMESRKGVPHVRYNDWVPINSEYLKVVYDDLVTQAGVHVLFFTTMAAVEMKQDGVVDAIIVANKAGLTACKAKVFIDCTGDGDLATWAGADYLKGDENGEVQDGTLCFTLSNIDPYEYSLIGSVHSNRKDSPVHSIHGNPKYPLVKDAHMNDKLVGPAIVGFNAGHVTVDSTNPESLSQAMLKGRKVAQQLHQGLREFEPKTFGASHLNTTGSLMGIRESRRIKCDYTFTLDDWLERKEFADGIGRNNYYIDVHKKDAKHFPRYKKGESHGIPFSCLTPVKLENVLVAGRCISTDPYAYGSLRVMPPSLVTGEAAGTAAAQIVRSKKPDVHNVDIKQLRSRLVEVGQLI